MLELLRVATGQETLLVKSDAAGIKSVVVAGIEIPTDHEGGIWVRYGPRDRGSTVSEIGRAHVELQSLMRISYAVFCLKKKKKHKHTTNNTMQTIQSNHHTHTT